MTKLSTIVSFLDNTLHQTEFNDSSLNGLQVESSQTEIAKVGLAVDAGLSIIEQATKANCSLLIVHHGLFWGEVRPITGPLGKKIELLMKHGCSLYASHLPLDHHLELGNGAQFAQYLGLSNITGFMEYKGNTVGAQGELKSASTITALADKCQALEGAGKPLLLSFGPPQIRRIGIVTGSGSFAVTAAKEADLDLLISGEPKHEVFHLAKELEMNVLFVGHYASETFGVKAVGARLAKDFGLSTVFFHEPSGI